ncbi:pyridine nucleotide-disulfide oxidoreductase domain-containing [Anaeramoeba flamelloides]|uniref:Pyridine nucleotide-disulfide oxidoreductase domain-containing n=1 Tax=Anaeramoeba flamelloides TaxID=1746091 RepID=A0ABQ8YF98_9EUKA|nr:pyridine nucleotide-disulfide oxidoreductase domain-containing [Anaeramoeba flamelloides]
MTEEHDIVIVGNGPVGRVIVHMMTHFQQNMKEKLSILMITKEPILAFRCSMPYGLDSEKDMEQFLVPPKMMKEMCNFKEGTVTEILPEENMIKTKTGESYKYKHLVLGLGSTPFIPPFKNVDCTNIVAFRVKEDLEKLREVTKNKKNKVAVIGGGYIGVEVAVELAELGIDVSIVEMAPSILPVSSEPELVNVIQEEVKKHGVKLYENSKVTGFTKEGNKAVAVELDGNLDPIPVDYVVMAVGVRPNSQIAENAGLETSRFGIKTDEFLRTTKYQNIWTSGDVLEKKSFISGKPMPSEFATTAVFTSKIVAHNIFNTIYGQGKKLQKYVGSINGNCASLFNYSIGQSGFTEFLAKRAGYEVVTGYSETPDKYPQLDPQKVYCKLVFDKTDQKLIGGTVLRKGLSAGQNADWISLAIQMGVKLLNIMQFQYSSHPMLNPKANENLFLYSAMDAMKKFMQLKK